MRLLANAPGVGSSFSFLLNPANNEYFEHYLQTIFILDELPNLPQIGGRKFVLAHIMAPHTPYVFSPNGAYSFPPKDKISGYRNNVEFLNARIIPVVRSIIEQSEIAPIIVIQGDHGPTGDPTNEQRLAILNAYYTNEEVNGQLYSSITPVNTFRLILNAYFGATFPLIEDVSYFIHKGNFRDFEIIANTCGD